jgi:enoyl-CoA hydratase/carnithine racemase
LCSDLVVASRDAIFGFPEVSVGLGVTGGISHLLPHLVGPAKAKELVLLGERFSAEEAHRLNLVTRLVDDGKHLDTALEMARALRDKPRRALARAKYCLDVGLEVGIDTAYEIEVANSLALHNTADADTASQAFRQRSNLRQSQGG